MKCTDNEYLMFKEEAVHNDDAVFVLNFTALWPSKYQELYKNIRNLNKIVCSLWDLEFGERDNSFFYILQAGK